jgi:hypothetical protein
MRVDLPQVDLERNAFLRVRLVVSLTNQNYTIMLLVLVGILNARFIFSILSYHKAFRADYISRSTKISASSDQRYANSLNYSTARILIHVFKGILSTFD